MSTVLTVGASQQYQTIGAAIAAANQLGHDVTIEILAGTYTNDGGTITATGVTVEGLGGVAKLVGVSADVGSKAALTIAGGNTVLTDLDVSGATAPGTAGILYTAGTLRLSNVVVHDNRTGIVSTDIADGRLDIETSVIQNNGTPAGGGNVDVGAINTLTVYASTVRGASGGSEIRSSAQTDTITYAAIADLSGAAAHVIDLPHGGHVVAFDTTIERGPNATTNAAIAWLGAGTPYANSSVTLNEVSILNDSYPNTAATLFDKTPASLIFANDSSTWNFPNVAAIAPPGAVIPMSTRYTFLNYDPTANYTRPTISSVTGMMDGGVTLRGTSLGFNTTVSISETVEGKTTLLGAVPAAPTGTWSFTSHVKIDPSKIHGYAISIDTGIDVTASRGGLFLTDNAADHLVAAPGEADIFAIMSFKGSDIIDGFKTSAATSYSTTHDVIDFSGRGISSFAQVQAMMSGSTSTILTMSSGKTITLTGVAPGTLSATDFTYS